MDKDFYLDDTKTYYEILNVEKTATIEEIKSSYKSLALKWHPDKNKSEFASDVFKVITEAYLILSNPEKKEQYDLYGKEENVNNIIDDDIINDLINNLFSFPLFTFNNNYQKVKITLEDVYKGGDKEIKRKIQKTCDKCNGKKTIDKKKHLCKNCNGDILMMFFGNPCVDCNGTGIEDNFKCDKCKGKGIIEETVLDNIFIPKGVLDNEIINDIIIKIEKHSVFDRMFIIKGKKENFDPSDLLIKLNIELVNSLCGFRKKITLLDGSIIKIGSDEIIKQNDVMKLNGKGLPKRDKDEFGDLYILFNIIYPETINKEEIYKIMKKKQMKLSKNFINLKKIEKKNC